MRWLRSLEGAIKQAPEQQVSLTDPDARSMATSGKGTGVVGYNVQLAVEAEHHLIVAHAVTNAGHDGHSWCRSRGRLSGKQILACEIEGIVPYVPKTLKTGALVAGRFGKQDFRLSAAQRCLTATSPVVPPSNSSRLPEATSPRLCAFSRIASNTSARAPSEELMTCSTSAVVVSRCNP
jgi:hypothetical protein